MTSVQKQSRKSLGSFRVKKIRVEKIISQLSWAVFPSSVRAGFFSHCISHTFSSEISLYVHSRAVLLHSWARYTRDQENQSMLWNAVSWTTCWCCEYSLILWLHPTYSPGTHGKLVFSLERRHFWTRSQLREGAHVPFTAPVQGQWETTPCRTKSQHGHNSKGEIWRPATERVWDALVHVSVQEESRQLLFLVGS